MLKNKIIGFIGLGRIGTPVVMNLLEKGYKILVYDINENAIKKVVDMGALKQKNASALSKESDIVITMVPDAPDVEKATLGNEGIIHGIRPGSVYIDMSTIDPITSRRIGKKMMEKGISMIDAPVAKTTENARNGTLAFMVGGEQKDVKKIMPLINDMGDSVVYCGKLGNGHAMKLVNNYISSGIIAILSEALTFGISTGLKLEDIQSLIMSTFAKNGILGELLPKKAFLGNFEPGFYTKLSLKDQKLALTLAKASGIKTPVGEGVLDALIDACNEGYEKMDLTSMLLVRENEAGIKVRSSK